jgi:mycothiol synthase
MAVFSLCDNRQVENEVVNRIQTITIRQSNEDDFSALADINHKNYPDSSKKAKQFRDMNSINNPKCRFARWVAVENDQVIGFADFRQWAMWYIPHEFFIEVQVHPDYQQRGIGNMLYQVVCDDLNQFQPQKLTTAVRNDQIGAIAFVECKGYVEYMRHVHWTIDVTHADVSAYASLESNLQDQGIVIKSLPQLADDPNRDRKLYDLYWQLAEDEPIDEDLPLTPIDEWIKFYLGDKKMIPDCYFVAVHGEDYIGTTSNWRTSSPNVLHIGMTGVRQAYTRRGIATALKLRGIIATQQYGAIHLKTDNEINNQPILKLNEKLGFTREYEWARYEKEISSNVKP